MNSFSIGVFSHEARHRGVDVSCDAIPYTVGSTTLIKLYAIDVPLRTQLLNLHQPAPLHLWMAIVEHGPRPSQIELRVIPVVTGTTTGNRI